MRIGVKYCGGCNPHYDRKKAVENWKEKMTGNIIEPVREEEEYNKILLVCGCARTCMKNYRVGKTKDYILLQREKDFEKIDCWNQTKEWEFILLEIQNKIAVLTISRPEKLNALNCQVYREISQAVDYIKERKVEGLIITGSGKKSFVAGADVGEMSRMSKEEAGRFSKICNEAFRKLECLPIPVIAAVNGYALGGGCELVLACHIRICSENAIFGLPEVTLGVIPGSGGTQRLPRLIGPGMAKELLFTGQRIDAVKAYQIGLISKVVSQEKLLDAAHELISDENTGKRR